jgi:hypothetical protein
VASARAPAPDTGPTVGHPPDTWLGGRRWVTTTFVHPVIEEHTARQVGDASEVTVHVVDLAGADPASVEALRRDVAATQALTDLDGLAEVLDVIEHPERAQLVVVSRRRGQSLAERLVARGPMAPQRATAIVVQLAGVLEAVHRAGLLHLWLSPCVIELDADGHPRLRGLGLGGFLHQQSAARDPAAEPVHGPTSGLTNSPAHDPTDGTASLAGASAAMAVPPLPPDVPLGPTTDVHLLARTLCLLVGAHTTALPGDDPASDGPSAGPPRPPDQVPPSDLPPPLADLLGWAQAAVATRRPPSMAAFADALRAAELASGWIPTAPAVPGTLLAGRGVGPGWHGTERSPTPADTPAHPIPGHQGSTHQPLGLHADERRAPGHHTAAAPPFPVRSRQRRPRTSGSDLGAPWWRRRRTVPAATAHDDGRDPSGGDPAGDSETGSGG